MYLKQITNNKLKNYELCPYHYLSGLSWDATFKMTITKLEVIPDPGMYIFLKKGTRGGISYISNRYSNANNKTLSLVTQKKNQKILYT